jgi:hypothetical protein
MDKTGKAQTEQTISALPPKADLPILELLPPPALRDRRHRGALNLGVAIGRRQIRKLFGFDAARASIELHVPARWSARDAQLPLDVGHHRVRQARLAEFREVLNDNALPQLAILPRDGLALVGKVERL